jgi:hypothetical protein
VNQLVLINRGKRPLLLLAGELIIGGKQDRIVAKDRIIAPGSDPLPLDVSLPNKQSYVASIAFSDNSGDSGVITVDYVELFDNRYEGVLEIITPQGLGIDRDGLIQSQSERMVERLDALPTQGTLASRSV